MMHATTILALRHKDHTVLAGDGQVTLGATVVKHSALTARQIAEESMRIAADICIYTNPNLTIEEL